MKASLSIYTVYTCLLTSSASPITDAVDHMSRVRERVCTFASDMDNDIYQNRRRRETGNLYSSFPIASVQDLCDRLYVFHENSILDYIQSHLCSDLFFLELRLSTYKQIPGVADICTELSDDFIPRCNTISSLLASERQRRHSHMTSASVIAPITPHELSGMSRLIRILYQFVVSFIFPASANK